MNNYLANVVTRLVNGIKQEVEITIRKESKVYQELNRMPLEEITE